MEFPFFISLVLALWCLVLLLFLFYRKIPAAWKCAASFIFIFYALWFSEELHQSWLQLTQQDLRIALESLGLKLWQLLPFLLLMLWPLSLYLSLSSVNSPKQAVQWIRGLSLVTLCYWLLYLSKVYLKLPFAQWLI